MSEQRHHRSHTDFPPYSRLFVVCSKSSTEAAFRESFSEFGKIEDLYLVKDRRTGENKGITYVQYGKTTHAAKALEVMNKKCLKNTSTPIKVLLASDNRGGEDKDIDEVLRARRLFVMIPKTMDENEFENEFRQFGDIEGVSIVRHKDTQESKGLGFVRYKSFYEAANAFENADRKFKAVFAEPKKVSNSYNSGGGNQSLRSTGNDPFMNINTPNPEGYTRLNVTFCPYLHQGLLNSLFDIVPGLEFCNIKINHQRRCGTALIGYMTPALAAYAREKLDGFEYPPGQPLVVNPDLSSGYRMQNSGPRDLMNINNTLKSAISRPNIDLVKLSETIAHATSLIHAAAGDQTVTNLNESFCSVRLPGMKELAHIDSPTVKRLFIVCQSKPPPLQFLKDAFRRFGDMIDMYILPHKTVGYVKYASEYSANEAMRTLHGAEICGVRMKVLEAEDQPSWGQKTRYESPAIEEESEDTRKRARFDD